MCNCLVATPAQVLIPKCTAIRHAKVWSSFWTYIYMTVPIERSWCDPDAFLIKDPLNHRLRDLLEICAHIWPGLKWLGNRLSLITISVCWCLHLANATMYDNQRCITFYLWYGLESSNWTQVQIPLLEKIVTGLAAECGELVSRIQTT